MCMEFLSRSEGLDLQAFTVNQDLKRFRTEISSSTTNVIVGVHEIGRDVTKEAYSLAEMTQPPHNESNR
jgi:hypothetical protein